MIFLSSGERNHRETFGEIVWRVFRLIKCLISGPKILIYPLPKSPYNNLRTPLNYRHISLLSVIGKLYTAVLIVRLVEYTESGGFIVNEESDFHASLFDIFVLHNAPLPQRPVAGRKLVGKWIFHFRPISSDIGRTHFNLSRKYSDGTLLAGVWSEQPVGNPIVTRHWRDTGRTFSSGLHRSSYE